MGKSAWKPVTYEDKVEVKVLELIVRKAKEKWPVAKDFAENFVKPLLGHKDPKRTGRVLKSVGRNQQIRRLKLAEILAACKLLDVKLHLILSDAEIEVDKEIQYGKPSNGKES
jgi:hypothetical protein